MNPRFSRCILRDMPVSPLRAPWLLPLCLAACAALPPDAHVQQSITLAGAKLTYTVTVGSLPVRDAEGKTTGELVYTAYTVPGADRPVTFAVNGGPGASSVYLNFGAIGPKHLAFGNEGDSPSDPATLSD